MIEIQDNHRDMTTISGAEKQRKGFLGRLRMRAATLTKGKSTAPPKVELVDSVDETIATAWETDLEDDLSTMSSSSSSDASANPLNCSCNSHYESLPNNPLHSCLDLLSSNDLDRNRLGMQRLNRLTTSSQTHSETACFVLVFGAPLGSIEELLRFFFVTMICDATKPGRTNSLRSVSSGSSLLSEASALADPRRLEGRLSQHMASEGSLLSEASLRHPQGKAEGLFHNHAIRILANALGRVYAAQPNSLEKIPLEDDLWKSIVMSLVENIEANHSPSTTLHSMKILRFLGFVRPEKILPLVRHTLFASLVHLRDYGKAQGLPLLAKEAEALLKRSRNER